MRRILCRATRRGRRVGIALMVSLLAGLTSVAATVPSAPPAAAATTAGYWLVGTDGGIFSFGKAAFLGSTGAVKLNQPIVGMAATPDGKGYWMVAADGGIFTFGSASFYGSLGAVKLNQPIVGMAPTRTGKGYWLVASDGGIFAFGDAGFFGSTGNIKLAKPIVDIVPTPSGRGYWMAASDGGIFAFGDAGFFGSTGAVKLAKRIQQMAATPTGKGYWMVAGDGGIFSFGDAKFYGSAVDGGPEKRIVDMAPSTSGLGYYLTASNGAVYAYGDAKPYGGLENQKLAHGIIAMVALNNGEPPVAVDDLLEISEDGIGSIDVLGNDRDPDGTPLTIQSVSGSAKGATVTVNGGTITYKPVPDSNGTDSFTYTVVDERGNTAIGTVTVRIKAVDDLPRTVDDTVTVSIGQPVTVNVLGNDSGLGDGLKLLNIVSQPRNGTATVAADGRSITYTGNKRGKDSLRYRVYDADDDNAEAVLNITVVGADLQPHAVDITLPCSANACTVDVLKTPGVALGDNGVISVVGEDGSGNKAVTGGTVHRQGSQITLTATAGNVGRVDVQYQIIDDNGGSPPDQVSLAVVHFDYQNSAPTAQSFSDPNPLPVSTPMDSQLSGGDLDGDALEFHVVGIGTTAQIDPNPLFHFSNGAFHFDGGPTGTYTITFEVLDSSRATSGTATYTFTVS